MQIDPNLIGFIQNGDPQNQETFNRPIVDLIQLINDGQVDSGSGNPINEVEYISGMNNGDFSYHDMSVPLDYNQPDDAYIYNERFLVFRAIYKQPGKKGGTVPIQTFYANVKFENSAEVFFRFQHSDTTNYYGILSKIEDNINLDGFLPGAYQRKFLNFESNITNLTQIGEGNSSKSYYAIDRKLNKVICIYPSKIQIYDVTQDGNLILILNKPQTCTFGGVEGQMSTFGEENLGYKTIWEMSLPNNTPEGVTTTWDNTHQLWGEYQSYRDGMYVIQLGGVNFVLVSKDCEHACFVKAPDNYDFTGIHSTNVIMFNNQTTERLLHTKFYKLKMDSTGSYFHEQTFSDIVDGQATSTGASMIKGTMHKSTYGIQGSGSYFTGVEVYSYYGTDNRTYQFFYYSSDVYYADESDSRFFKIWLPQYGVYGLFEGLETRQIMRNRQLGYTNINIGRPIFKNYPIYQMTMQNRQQISSSPLIYGLDLNHPSAFTVNVDDTQLKEKLLEECKIIYTWFLNPAHQPKRLLGTGSAFTSNYGSVIKIQGPDSTLNLTEDVRDRGLSQNQNDIYLGVTFFNKIGQQIFSMG